MGRGTGRRPYVRFIVGTLCAELAACGAVLAIAPAAWAALDQRDIKRSELVETNLLVGPSGESNGTQATCPQGTRLLSGGSHFTYVGFVGTGPSQITSSGPLPNGRGWYAAINNSNSTASVNLDVNARCLPRAKLDSVKTRMRPYPVADAADGGGATKCANGDRIVTGGAFWTVGGAMPVPNPATAGQAALASLSPLRSGRGWYADGANQAGASADLDLNVVARCAPADRLADLTRLTDTEESVEPGEQVQVAGFCTRRRALLTGGAFWHPPDQNRPQPTFAAGKRWSSGPTDGRFDQFFANARSFAAPTADLTGIGFCLGK
jgi:hypothetical protein